MLSNSGLPKHFWAEAVRTACYLINRSPTTSLDGGIPEKVWTGKELYYSHLKVFGCEAYVHISKEQRSKLDEKSLKCIFLGYADNELGYRLWDPIKRRIIRSRDVIFNEGQMFKNTDKSVEMQKFVEIIGQQEAQQENMPPLQEATAGNNNQPLRHNGNEEQQEVETVQEPLQEIPVRRSTRPQKVSQRYPLSNYILLTDEGEPSCFQEACQDEHSKEWQKAMEDEMDSLQENRTWELVKLPKKRKALRNKWVYKIKHEGDEKKRYKARLVVKGFA